MSHTHLHSVIDVECVNNRSMDIIAFIIKVCRRFLLNNKIFTFHGDHGRSVLVEIPARLEDNVK